MTTAETLKSNPWFTYGQAIGYSAGRDALAVLSSLKLCSSLKTQVLSDCHEMLSANDDYAQGFRKAIQEGDLL